MSSGATISPPLAAPVMQDMAGKLRGGLFVAIFLAVIITFSPYSDLSGVAANSNDAGSQTFFYLVLIGMAALAWFLLDPRDRQAMRKAFTPGLIAFYVWVLMSVLFSTDPGLSARRLVPLVAITGFGASLFLLPRNPRHMAQLLAIVCGVILVMSYFGVVFLPQYSIHQATDPGEPMLAGDWRGVFAHKNIAAGVFAMTGFMGLYVARKGMTAAGWSIFAFSALFLIFSGGKTSFLMFFATLPVSYMALNTRSRLLRSAIVLLPCLFLGIAGLDSVMSPTIASFTKMLPIDTTFTGRDKIWRFALAHAATRPWTGYGYEAFWSTDYAKFGSDNPEEWSGEAAHAHNAFLNIALTTGIPGLVLTLAVFVFGGINRFNVALARGADPALLALNLQMWSFGLYLSDLESTILLRADPIWMIMLFSLFNLNYMAHFSICSDSASDNRPQIPDCHKP